jgi:acyl-CoA reductase-like NAD-dependent aldehyde dehydrogenase
MSNVAPACPPLALTEKRLRCEGEMDGPAEKGTHAMSASGQYAMNWKQLAAGVSWKIEPFINGRYRRSTSTELFDNINPATETILCRVPVGNAADIDEAVRIARQRFDDGCWSELPPIHRAEILRRLADLLVEHSAELALMDAVEMGKPIQAALDDARIACPLLLRSYAGFADKLLGVSAPLSFSTLSFNTYEPRGVVGAITPWNFPLLNAVTKLGPALAAGNSLVLKPSELSASSALKLAELALQAGIPEGVLNVVPGLGSTVGSALALHPDVNLLSFTGSTATGRKIMELSGRSNGKPLLLECGGKSPQVVFNDVENLDAVADAIVQSVLWNQGQVCSAHTRLIVHEQIKDAVLDKIVSRACHYKPADPLDETTTFGPLASPAQRDRVKAYIEQGLRAGARALLMGAIQESDGCYISPTIFDRVDSTMAIVREEIFGPVLCAQSFKTDEEAIALANGTDYGLVATVWTRDMGRSKRLAHAIKAGVVYVRTSGLEGSDSGCILGFEPQKASGFGSEFGLRSLEAYSTLKSITLSGA